MVLGNITLLTHFDILRFQLLDGKYVKILTKKPIEKVGRCSIKETIQERVITRNLSVQPDDCIENIGSMPPALIKKVWFNAEIPM